MTTAMPTRPIDRALEWMRERGWKQADLARELRVPTQTITNWKARGMPPEHHATIAALFRRSVDELLGTSRPGPDLVVTTAAGPGAVVEAKRFPAEVPLQDNPDFPAVRRVRFKLSAGASGFAVEYLDDDDAPIVFRREWFASRGLQPARLFAVRVANGSMQPGLWEGDTVIVNTADTDPRDGDVFAVNFEGELVVKRMQRDEGRWWLSSDNPDKTRYPRKACGDGVFVIGRVVHKQSEHL